MQNKIRSAITISMVEEARSGPFVFYQDLSGACAAVAELGFDAVEIFPPSAAAVRSSTLKRDVQDHQLSVAALGTGAGWVKHKLRLTDPDRLIRQRARKFVEEIIECAGEYGAATIIGSMQGRCDEGRTREDVLGWLAEELVYLGEFAVRAGSTLLYEPLNRYETNLFTRQEEAAHFLKSAGAGQVKLLCDLFHMNIEEVSMADALRKAGPMVGHIHFVDSNRRAVGYGHTEMETVIQALKEIQYAGYLSAECLPLPDPLSAASQTIRSFKRWFP